MDFYEKHQEGSYRCLESFCVKSKAIIFAGVLWKPSDLFAGHDPFACQLLYAYFVKMNRKCVIWLYSMADMIKV